MFTGNSRGLESLVLFLCHILNVNNIIIYIYKIKHILVYIILITLLYYIIFHFIYNISIYTYIYIYITVLKNITEITTKPTQDMVFQSIPGLNLDII